MPEENICLYAKWETISAEEALAYEKELASYSKQGHLYIHYKRFEHTKDDYADWNLWVWAKESTGREFEWMVEDNAIKMDNYGGAVAEIDLTKTYTDAGNSKTETITYLNSDGSLVEQIGFLIVYKDSKNGAGHWQSDGGNQYFYTADGLRDDGSIHLFTVQDNVSNYTFKYSSAEITNPYDGDDGSNVSSKYDNVDSSSTSKYASPSSVPSSPV